ncbi:hypothetical protein LR68_01636 [Anoxybacillus sp. BCO1]|nr:hypothetical protein LR68_01636 [Anoxybacillus sp. BCO1]
MNEKQRLQYTAQIETDHPTDKKSALDDNLQRLKQKNEPRL